LNHELLEILSLDARPGNTGAIGRNKEQYITVAFQRGALKLILYGISTGRLAPVEDGLRSINYGFGAQTPDGGFRSESYHGQIMTEGDKASSAAFFLSAVGMSYCLISDSPFADRFAGDLTALRPKLAKAIEWLKERRERLLHYDREAPNRLAFDAVAFKSAGLILNDDALSNMGTAFANSVLEMQRQDGVFLEKNGYDTSYQATALMVLQYYWLLAQKETAAKRVRDAIARGIAWEKTRIIGNGKVSAEGNTRTGNNQEKFMGKPKEVNYWEIAQAFMLWAVIGEDPKSGELATTVLTHRFNGMSPSQWLKAKALERQIHQKRETLLNLTKRPGIPKMSLQEAKRLYKQGETAYNAGRIEEALGLLDHAINTLSK
jgi:hypothetical protein